MATRAATPTLTTSSRITGGASTVQTSLFTAKSMALRDQFPRGVRLVQDSDGLVRTLQYLEQPPPYFNGVLLGHPRCGLPVASFRDAS